MLARGQRERERDRQKREHMEVFIVNKVESRGGVGIRGKSDIRVAKR